MDITPNGLAQIYPRNTRIVIARMITPCGTDFTGQRGRVTSILTDGNVLCVLDGSLVERFFSPLEIEKEPTDDR